MINPNLFQRSLRQVGGLWSAYVYPWQLNYPWTYQ